MSTSSNSFDPLDCDLVVVGGGILGLFTAIAAAKRNRNVILVDQFEPLHAHGSSHGDGRVYRLAYSDLVYLDLMSLSLPLWQSLSSHSDDKLPLIVETGCLSMQRSVDGSLPTQIRDLCNAFEARGINYEIMSSEKVSQRFEQFSLPSDVHSVHVQDGGVLFAARCMRAAVKCARFLGVKVVTPFRAAQLKRVEHSSHELELISDTGKKVLAHRCVLAPGAWITDISERMLGLSIPTLVSAENVNYYALLNSEEEDKYITGNSMPVFIMLRGPEEQEREVPIIYGLPIAEIGGVKVSAHYCGPEVSPDARPAAAGGNSPQSHDVEKKAREKVDKSVAEASKLVRTILPGLDSTPFRSDSCLYTRTRDCHLIIDTAPGWAELVVLAGGGSGHAFKLAPGVGECAAALAIGEKIPIHVGELSVKRLMGKSQGEGSTFR